MGSAPFSQSTESGLVKADPFNVLERESMNQDTCMSLCLSETTYLSRGGQG